MPALVSRGRGRRSINEINMVPFIDVMLVLLIIFMVTAPLITTGVVELPSVGKSQQRPGSVIEIVVGTDEKLRLRLIDGSQAAEPAPVTLAQLAARVREHAGRQCRHAGGDQRRPQREVRQRRARDGHAAEGRRQARRPVGQAGVMNQALPDALLPRPPEGMASGAALACWCTAACWRRWRWACSGARPRPRSSAPSCGRPCRRWPRRVPSSRPRRRPRPPRARPCTDAGPAAAAAAAINEAQIAIERAERRRLERAQQEEAARLKAKADADKRAADKKAADKLAADKKAADEKKRQADERKAEEARLAQLREDQLRRMMGSLPAGTGPATSTGTAAQDAAPSQAYVGLLVRKIRSNWVYSGAIDGNPAAEVEVVAAAGGSIIARRLVKSSGNPDYDDSVLRAIDRTRELPRDTDGRVPKALIITFRPKE